MSSVGLRGAGTGETAPGSRPGTGGHERGGAKSGGGEGCGLVSAVGRGGARAETLSGRGRERKAVWSGEGPCWCAGGTTRLSEKREAARAESERSEGARPGEIREEEESGVRKWTLSDLDR